MICFDEIHSETWTIDSKLARELGGEYPEYHYYGHFAELAQRILGAPSARITSPWASLPEDIRVLVIPHPALPHSEKGCGGNPIFSEEEVQYVQEFVSRGGGLFVIGEYDINQWGSNINDLLSDFGLMLNNDTLLAPRREYSSCLLMRHFLCTHILEHPTTVGITGISYHRGCSITCNGPNTQPLIYAPNGEIVCAASTYGAGRVVVIGDSDLFSIPFIGHAQNGLFLVNILAWLGKYGGRPQSTALKVHAHLSQKSYDLVPQQHSIDLRTCPGNHIVDASSLHANLLPLIDRKLPNPYREPDSFIIEAELAFHQMPEILRRKVIEFTRHGNPHGILVIKSLPVDPNLPKTPNILPLIPKDSFYSEFWLAAFGAVLGDPISYLQQKDGALFQNVYPTKKDECELSSDSSKTVLDFHTETAFHPIMPDFLLLYCLRPDHDRLAMTFTASISNMIPYLPLQYRSVLFEEKFQTGIDQSFGSPSGLQGNGPIVPVLSGRRYRPYMRYDLDLMVGLTEVARQSLVEMKRAANLAKDFVYLSAGDLLIIDNRHAVHGRSIFTPKYDGLDRWLQRLYVVRDLVPLEEERRRAERIITTAFAL